MKNYMLMLSLTLVVAVTNVTWASVQFYEDEQLWSNAVANVEVFEITASNVSLANQVQTLPQYNTNVGVLLTFDRANTGLSRSFELEALQQDGLTGEGFVFYPEGTEAPGHDASLAVGDGHPLPSKHDNDDWSMTIIDGRPLYGFSFDLLENDLFNNEDDDILRVYDTEGTLIFTRPSIPEGPGTLFIGVVSDVPIGKIEFDEGDDLDNIAIANFCFGSIRPQVTILLDEEGQLNGQVINSENNAIQVLTGQEISGTINCIVDSNYAPSAQVPVAGTVTWGDRAEQPWMIQAHVTPGLNDLSVEIDLAVPSTPGWYNIIIASAGEFTEDQIMSATNWSLGAVTWNDDNDLGWDWNEDQYDEAKLYGFVENLHQSTDWSCPRKLVHI